LDCKQLSQTDEASIAETPSGVFDKNEQTMKNQNLTELELLYLNEVANRQTEDNYSEYQDVGSNQEKGVLGSLIKKGLVYDAYEGMDMGYMFCLTEQGFDTCKSLEISTSHIIVY